MKRSFCFFFTLCLFLSAKAQLTVDKTITVQSLVENVLLGTGVSSENIVYNQGPADFTRNQVGFFSGAGPYIGIDSGIILASGGAEVAEGPNDIPTAHVTVPASEQLNSDADLSQLVGGSVLRDVATIEFDFQAQGDTLRFRYVFASEEYNDHTCSPYNDVFGFFISGPGITGNPNFANSAKNIALVPGTQVPVAINTVNQGFAGIYGSDAVCNASYSNWQSNSAYFVNNAGNSDPGTTQFDGFTVPFLVEVPVICGETYHIKLAIADAVDDKNDSAVFIEAQSFNSEILLDASLEVLNPESDQPNVGLEGCSAYKITMFRSDSLSAKTVYLRSRDLTNAHEVLSDFPESVTFQAGEAFKEITINTQNDGFEQGMRAWFIDLLLPGACGQDTALFALPVQMNDRPELSVQAPQQLAQPCHEPAQLNVEVSGGNPPYSIAWHQEGMEGFQIQVALDQSSTIQALVSDQCNLNQRLIAIEVDVETFEDLELSLPESISFGCVDPIQVQPTIEGGTEDMEFIWSQGNNVLSNNEILDIVLNTPGTIELKVTDRCAGEATAQLEAILLANPVTVQLGDDQQASCSDELTLVPEVTGGFGNLNYLWKLNNNEVSAQSIFSFQPTNTVRVSLRVNDQCGQEAADTMFVFNQDLPLEVLLPADTVICRGQRLELKPLVQGAVGEVTYHWPISGGNMPTYVLIPQRSNTFKVVVKDGCDRSAEAATNVVISEINADFDFDYDYPERPIINRSTPDRIYLWTFPDGTESQQFAPVYIPEQGQTAPVLLQVADMYGCEASAMEFYDPPMSIFIPTAFTPDGDGLNDLFHAKGHNVAEFHLIIFDKWGTVVFESNDITQAWNGESPKGNDAIAGDNIYPYRYVARSWSGQVKEGKGTVTLLR